MANKILSLKQEALLKEGVSVMVKHYESGTFTFIVMKHNGDATGWTKISGFMNKSYYNYDDALAGGIEWWEKFKITGESDNE